MAVPLGTEWLCHEKERCRASRHKSSGLPQTGRKPGATYTRYPSGEHEKRAGRAAPLHKTKEGTIQSKANSQEWLFHKEERCKTRG